MSKIKQLHTNRFLIDVYDLGIPNRTGSYFLDEEKKAIIDTSASPSIPYLLEGLKALHIKPEEIDYIIVTHIHLDHAGGAGVMLEHCSNAKLVVHPKGARHLNDPSKLILGAKQVYGDKFNTLFEPILPIPKERILVMQDLDTLTLSEVCTLTFLDTPGHANHHFSIYDSATNGMYTGDTIGVNYEAVLDFPFFLPSTSPNQFNPELMLKSVEIIESHQPDWIYFGHFGETSHTEEVLKQVRYWIPIFLDTTEKVLQKSTGEIEGTVSQLSAELYKQVIDHLKKPMNSEMEKIVKLDLQVCSMGLIDYFAKRSVKPSC